MGQLWGGVVDATNWKRTTKYLVIPVAVLCGAVAAAFAGILNWTLALGDVLNTLFVAVLVSLTWFYADETASLRRSAAEELRFVAQANEMKRARIVFRPIPAEPPGYRPQARIDPPIDPLSLGVELVNAGGTAARDIRLSILFYQANLSTTSASGTSNDSDREDLVAPRLPVLLPGETRTFSAPFHWRSLSYMSADLVARISGEYQDGVERVVVDDIVEISTYMRAAAKTRMMDYGLT